MPDIRLPKCPAMPHGGVLSVVGEYKPGDMPPSGYIDRAEWAEVQMKAGLKQERCGRCSRWQFPQELSEVVDETTGNTRKDGKGKTVTVRSPVCKECAGNAKV